MADHPVRVEIDEAGKPVRVFGTVWEALLFSIDHPESVKTMSRAEAVLAIRQQVYTRSNGDCEWCGETVTWKTGEMHEKKFKGKGGEVSLVNCVFLCHACHQGRASSAHGDRRWGGRQ